MIFNRQRAQPATVPFHLNRLTRFALLTADSRYRFVPDARTLVDRAVLAEYRTLRELGAERDARVLLNNCGLWRVAG